MVSKVANSFMKLNSSVSLNDNTDKKTSNNDNFIENSQKFFQKIYKLTMDTIASNQEEYTSNNTPAKTIQTKPNHSVNVSQTIPTPTVTRQSSLKSPSDVKSMSYNNGKPKGILKTTEKKVSTADSTKVVYNNQKNIQFSRLLSPTVRTSNIKEHINSYTKAKCLSSSSASNKRVTFHDRVSRKRYRPQKEISDGTKPSVDQPKKSQTFQHKDALYARAMNSIKTNTTVSSKSNQTSDCQSNEYESSGDESCDLDY